MEETLFKAIVVLSVLLSICIVFLVHFWHVSKRLRYSIDSKDREIDEQKSMIDAKDTKISELENRAVKDAIAIAELNGQKTQADRNLVLMEETEAKLHEEIVRLNREIQEKEDYAHWVGTSALETNEAYYVLQHEKEQLEKKLLTYEAKAEK